MLRILILLVCLLPIEAFTETANSTALNNTIVFEEHGILLQPKGLVALDANEQLISIFKKIKIPAIEKPANCPCTWLPKFNADIMETTTYYTNLFQQIGNPPSRKKRFLGAIGIGLGFVDLLLTGISYGSLKSHIDKVEERLGIFIATQHSFDEKMIFIDKEIVHSIARLENDVNSSLKRIQSQILDSSGALMASELKLRWETKLKEVFRAILDGTITTGLTPLDLTPTELESIINDHSFLKNTYFAKNAFSLYKTATITMTHAYLDIQSGALIVHLVMSFPMVEKPLAAYYEVSQTGIMKNDTCFLLDLPEYVYVSDSTFHPLDRKYCKLFQGIATCFSPMLKNSSCLESLPQCRLNRKTCTTSILFDNAGILLTANKSEAITISTEQGIKATTTGPLGTAFLPWKDITSVQIGQYFVEKPTLVSSHIESNLSSEEIEDWRSAVSQQVTVQTHMDSIMKQLQSAEADLMISQSSLSPESTETIAIVAMTTAAITALIAVVLCVWTCKSNINCCRSTSTHQPIQTTECDDNKAVAQAPIATENTLIL